MLDDDAAEDYRLQDMQARAERRGPRYGTWAYWEAGWQDAEGDEEGN